MAGGSVTIGTVAATGGASTSSGVLSLLTAGSSGTGMALPWFVVCQTGSRFQCVGSVWAARGLRKYVRFLCRSLSQIHLKLCMVSGAPRDALTYQGPRVQCLSSQERALVAGLRGPSRSHLAM